MRRLVAIALVVMSAACADDGPSPAASEVPGVVVPPGFSVEVIAEGLGGPTQLAAAPDGGLLVAELNGGERDGTGRVVRIDPDDSRQRTVLVDGLLTPTGIAVDGELLWIMEQRRLTVGPLADPSDRTVVLDDLPFNGRSEGTISAVEGGGILFDTSGTRRGDQLVSGSGALWYLAGPGAEPEPYATGFKHAYAHTPTGDGRWFVTEISDGRLDGEVPPDEVVIVSRGDDFGYPRCIGDGVAVAELGASAEDCAGTPPSHAVFEPRATPTSVVVAPWDPDTLLVALWNTGEIVSVPAVDERRPDAPVLVIGGIEHPQHLLANDDRLLVSDHGGGRILAVGAGDAT